MTRVLGFLHKLEWGNPYVAPPNGVKVAMEIFIPTEDESCRQWPKEMEEKYWELRKEHKNGIYSHSIRALTKLSTELSQGALRSIRQKRLMRRMEEKYPLFAEVFAQEELIRKKDYYDGITDPSLVEKRAEVQEEHRQLLESWGLKG